MSFYKEINPYKRSPCAAVWTGLVPPRVDAFYRLAVEGKISMEDVLRRRGLVLDTTSDTCHLCGREMESIDHFFFFFIHCNVDSSIWRYFLNECGVSWCFPGFFNHVVEAWRGLQKWDDLMEDCSSFHSFANLERKE